MTISDHHDLVRRSSVHPFPARMAPSIVSEIIGNESGPTLRILDPMTGSGTVPAIALRMGHEAVGVDSDPLAVLIARVWTHSVEPDCVTRHARRILHAARGAFGNMSQADAYPVGADEETRKFLRFWFDPYVRRQLKALADRIRAVPHKVCRDVLWCAFSRLIITKSSGVSRARDLSHSRPHRAFTTAPVKPFRKFELSVKQVLTNCLAPGSRLHRGRASIRHGDARKLPLRKSSFDLVITSPPYLNAIDYMRCSKFSLAWMGYDVSALRAIRARSVGTERADPGSLNLDRDLLSAARGAGQIGKLSTRDRAKLFRYLVDMRSSLKEVRRVLKPGSKAVYVIGDSNVRKTFISNSEALIKLASNCGFRLLEQRQRALPPNRRYLPPPSRMTSGKSFRTRMRKEVVLVFKAG